MSQHVEHSSMPNTADRVRRAIEAGGERVWSARDFPGLPSFAVSQALSRLTRRGSIQRVGKGLYYRPRPTPFGSSRPNPALLNELVKDAFAVFPAGLTAANLLGFSTQVPAREELATTRGSLPRSLVGGRARLHTRRPEAWAKLSDRDAALLDFIRRRGATSELSPEQTVKKLLAHLKEGGTFERLLRVARHEPPRVRAMLGALGDELAIGARALKALRAGLNPLSKFDFGVLSVLPSARSWQARERKGR